MKKAIAVILIILTHQLAFSYSQWIDIGPPGGVTVMLIAHPTDANKIYWGSDAGHVFRSDDKGISWKRISGAVANMTQPQRQYRGGEHEIAIDRRAGKGNIVYYSPGQADVGLWKSTDFGDNFQKLSAAPAELSSSVLSVDYNGVVYAATSSHKMYRSMDEGNTWTSSTTPFNVKSSTWGGTLSYKHDIEIGFDNSIYIADRYDGAGIMRSTDGGKTWIRVQGGWILDIACSPTVPGLVAALEQDGTIYVSENGANFRKAGVVNQSNYWKWSTWPAHTGGITINGNGDIIAIGRYSMGISLDKGQTFKDYSEGEIGQNWDAGEFVHPKRIGYSNFLKCCKITSSPVDPDFFIFGDGQVLKRSTNKGVNWRAASNGAHGLWVYGNPTADIRDKNVFHIPLVDNGHNYTTNGGATWNWTPDNQLWSCQGVAQDFNNPSIFYKMNKSNGGTVLDFFKSSDGGHNFSKTTSINMGTDGYGGRIRVDQSDPTGSTIYATMRFGNGIYKSTNGGQSFSLKQSQSAIHNMVCTKNGNVFVDQWYNVREIYLLKKSGGYGSIWGGKVNGFAVHPDDDNIVYANETSMWGKNGPLWKTNNALSSSPTWQQLGNYGGMAIYIDPYQPNYMLNNTNQPGKGIMWSSDAGVTWKSINTNHPFSFVWGFVAGGDDAKGRVYSYDAAAAYIENLYDPNFASVPLISYPGAGSISILETAVGNNGGLFALNSYVTGQGINISYGTGNYDGPVNIAVYDVFGKRVQTLVNRHHSAGSYRVRWDGSSNSGNRIANSVYFVNLKAGNQVKTNKVVIGR